MGNETDSNQETRFIARGMRMRVLALALLATLLAPLGCGGSPHEDAGPLDASGVCNTDEDCDDGLFCNGRERCFPSSPLADSAGCAPTEDPCLAAQTCMEDADLCRTECDITGDADGDGHDYIDCGGDDCDDSQASRYPGNIEVCDGDGRDEDCDPTTLGADGDMDGDSHLRPECCNLQADGRMLCGGDCDDAQPTVNPSALEVCNGDVDDDCNGLADSADGVCVPCADGYRGFDLACEDIDECVVGAPCGGAASATCTNTPGSYRCDCPTGYAAPAEAGTCQDVDECALGAPCGSAAGTDCINIPGAYVCSCGEGYASPAVGGTCADVDECATGAPCGVVAGTICLNSTGSYACRCPAGFSAPAAGGTCIDEDECALGAPCGRASAWLACANIFGSYACSCNAGYVGPATGGACQLDDASLASLTASVGSFTPTFDPAITSYTLDLPWGTTAVQLTATVLDAIGATLRIEGAIVASGTASAPITVSNGSAQQLVVEVTTETGRVLRYELNIVPSTTYAKASNTGSQDQFGSGIAVSADGMTLAVGAPGEGSSATGVDGDQADNSMRTAGAVYIFRKLTSGTWVQDAYIKASNASAGDRFGTSLALSADGSTLAVGAMGEQSVVPTNPGSNGGTNVGAAYVFTRTGGAWTQQAYVKASDPVNEAWFGYALALSADGTTLSVAALGHDRIYIFIRVAGSWSQQARFAGSNTTPGDGFGRATSLSADGSTLVVGALTEDSAATTIDGDGSDNSALSAGAAYLFRRSGTAWTQEAYLKASNTNAGDNFGASVAISADGSTVAVGAYEESSAATGVGGNESSNAAPFAGAAYVFVRGAASWTQQAYVKSSNMDSRDIFGAAVALSADGSTLVVGAHGEASSATGVNGDETDNSLYMSGAAYVYARSGGLWSQHAYVKASNTGRNDRYGAVVALSADATELFCGAIGEGSNATGFGGDETNDSLEFAGAIYIYVN